MKEVAVVIPIYKNILSDFETISLTQCLHILHQYPIIIAKPKSLNISNLEAIYPQLLSKSFDDDYFKNVKSYNDLMLSKDFYEKFTDYKHILIYQLDAFVFSDQLSHWCSLDYDYVGAPWISDEKGLTHTIKKKMALFLKLKYSDGSYFDIIRTNEIGNGGFSLRKVETCLKIISKFKKEIIYYSQTIDSHRLNEDVFWGVEVNRFRKNIKIPDKNTALQFAFEHEPQKALTLNQEKLPFGCHAWERYDFTFWKPYIEVFGYKL